MPFMPIGKSKTVKENIVHILSQQWPLTAKKLYNIIKKDRNISYQAVHKTLRELINENIIKEHNKQYQLSHEWIEAMYKKMGEIENNYNNHLPFVNNYVNVNVLDSINETMKFQTGIGRYFHKLYGKGVIFCSHYFHSTWPIAIPERLNALSMQKNTRKVFCLCSGNTELDKWCCEKEREFGYAVKSGTPCATTCDISTYGDFVVETYLPGSLKKKIDEFYNSVHDINELNISKFFSDICGIKTKILILVMKNNELASMINQHTLSCFKNSRQKNSSHA